LEFFLPLLFNLWCNDSALDTCPPPQKANGGNDNNGHDDDEEPSGHFLTHVVSPPSFTERP
jgi:hypothetical protein